MTPRLSYQVCKFSKIAVSGINVHERPDTKKSEKFQILNFLNLRCMCNRMVSRAVRPSKKEQMFLVRNSTKKRERASGRFLCYFQLNAFFTHYYPPPPPGDKLEFLGQILIK